MKTNQNRRKSYRRANARATTRQNIKRKYVDRAMDALKGREMEHDAFWTYVKELQTR